MDKSHVSRKAIIEFGEIAGCPACEVIRIRGDRPGRIGKHHSEECRQRILEKMKHDPAYRHLAKKYKSRTNDDADNVAGDVDNVGQSNNNRGRLTQMEC